MLHYYTKLLKNIQRQPTEAHELRATLEDGSYLRLLKARVQNLLQEQEVRKDLQR
eukprot:m.682145 g.682145  ORF g.682145 m.682145 type:complete len:55 (-) comp58603_c1_seq18:1670-1834(-)